MDSAAIVIVKSFRSSKRSKPSQKVRPKFVFRHSLLCILNITISLNINFTWINNVSQDIFDLWTYILPERIFYMNIYLPEHKFHLNIKTLFFCKQRFFQVQPQCSLALSWIELQILLRCFLIHIRIIIPGHFIFSILMSLFRSRSVYIVSMWSFFHFYIYSHYN